MELSNSRLMVGADWGPRLWGFFRPSARVAAGYAWSHLQIDTPDTQSTPEREDWAHDFVASASLGVGVEYRFGGSGPVGQPELRSNQWTLGLGLRGGYMWQTEATFDEMGIDEDQLSEEDPWTRAEASAGSLDLGGPLFEFLFSLRYDLE